MKKKLFLLLLWIVSMQSFASHVLGGSIHWTKTSSGQFIFEVHVMKECGLGGATYVTPTIVGPNGSIPLTIDTTIEVSPMCTGTGQLSCGVSVSGKAAIMVYILKSAPISLTGTPPASGWDFTWYSPGRQPAVNIKGGNNYFIKSTMYPGGDVSSPRLSGDVNMTLSPINKTFLKNVVKGAEEDSLYYFFEAPMTSATAQITYDTLFGATHPFPSNSNNSLNGIIALDGNSGLITLDASTGVSGFYALGIAVEQWRNGVKLSKTFIDHHVYYDGSVTTNNSPDVRIDTSVFSSIRQTGAYSYKTEVTIGDTVEFNIVGEDNDVNSSTSVLQEVSFDANGSALSSAWGGLNSYQVMPALVPVLPQSGFSSSDSNVVNFRWAVGNEHYSTNNNSHFFTFSFKDDQCPYPGMTNVTLEVVVQKAVRINTDTVHVCSGDSVQLNGYSNSGMYSWYPSVGLSNSSVANPMALPSASGYYYLIDSVSGAKDSVYASVSVPKTFNLDTINGKLQLIDANASVNRVWHFNGIPFYYPLDTLSPIGYGDYWVTATAGPCTLISDTINIAFGSSFSIFDPNNGGYNGVNMTPSGSIGATFQISQSANLNSVTLIGVEDLYKSGTGYDLNLKIYDANQQEVFTTDVTLTPPFFGPQEITVGYPLVGNVDYTVAITGDTALTFKLYENVSYPATPHNNGITLSGSYEGVAKQFPAQPSNYLLPIILNADVQGVGLEESLSSKISVYPNPAKDVITISGFETEGQVQLLDIQGKMLRSYKVSSTNLVVKRDELPSGVYFLNVSVDNETETIKVIFR